MNEAVALGRQVLRHDPDYPLARFVAGVDALRARRYDDARSELSRAGAGPLDLATVILTAWSWLGAGSADNALELLDRVKDERVARFRDYHAGLIADVRGYTYEARKRLRTLYQADPRTLRTVDAYARFLARTGAYDQARQVYGAFDKAFPRHPLVAQAMADLDAGRLLAPLAPDALAGAAEALYGIGAASASQPNPQSSLIFLRLAVWLDPGHALAWTGMGEIYTRIRQHQLALEAYKSIPAAAPLRALVDTQAGTLLRAMGRAEEAIAHMRGVLERRPNDLGVIETLADILRTEKRWIDAIEVYSRGIKLVGTPAPSDWRWFFMRGIAYERSKQWPLAEADLRMALKLNPDQPQVLNYLGYTWADKGVNLSEALVMLEKAASLAPKDGHIVDSLGWVYFRLGRYEDALRELERALGMLPAEAVINEHMGDVFWKLGRRREAVFKWAQARDLNPEPDELARIVRKLDDAAHNREPSF
jgi:tetratricopeptide (TPR) repeat protein